MNLSYSRKSASTHNDVIDNCKKTAKKLGIAIQGISSIDDTTVVYFANNEWTKEILSIDTNLIGLLPTTLLIKKAGNETVVSVPTTTILGSITQNAALQRFAEVVQSVLKNFVEGTADVKPLQPQKIKLYSTTTCPYCKMEASWLDEQKVNYDEVHVDMNQAEAEEMVKKTGQMGVPVTAVTYDNGEEEYIVGFDKQHLEAIVKQMK